MQSENDSYVAYWKQRAEDQGKWTVGHIGTDGDEQDKDYLKRVAFMLGKFPKDLETIDYGCGIGRYAKLFNPDLYTGIDITEYLLSIAKEENPKYTFVHQTNLLPEQIPQAELFFTATVLQHNTDLAVSSILKKAAHCRVFALYENTSKNVDKFHVKFRTPERYVELLESAIGRKCKEVTVTSHVIQGEEHSLIVCNT